MAEEESNIGLGCALERFQEAKEVTDLIQDLPKSCRDPIDLEMAKERYMKLLDYYQEQPHLLDSHLTAMLELLMDHVLNNKDTNKPLVHATSSFAAHLIKVRGYKVVVRQLPHEVKHVEPVLQLLEEQDPKSPDDWETRYFLLLWMSILVMIPFHMSRFDSNSDGDSKKKTVMERVLGLIKSYLAVSDKCQDAAAFLSAKFITRPEIVSKFLPEYLDWALQCIGKSGGDDRTNEIVKTGSLKSLAAILKHGKRDDLIEYAPVILQVLESNKLNEAFNVHIRKLTMKVVQRLGLTFLKAKVAKWRYNRGSRSLKLNLDNKPEAKIENGTDMNEEEEDYDVPDEIEDVIEQLLTGLKNQETIIRWSAAKGIGRVTSRLPQELADDVVGSLLQLFSLRESDSAWHGGCLALAELARRGLLMPQR